MATSGSYNFNVTALEILEESHGLIGAHDPGETLDATEAGSSLRTLNMMLKIWHKKYGLWLIRELSLFLQDDTISYDLGLTGDHCAANAVKTELSAAAASAATSAIAAMTSGSVSSGVFNFTSGASAKPEPFFKAITFLLARPRPA